MHGRYDGRSQNGLEILMPYGKGSYGTKKGRPPKKTKPVKTKRKKKK